MNEIEKLYENAGIVPDCEHGECGLDYCPNNYGCGYAFYPEFTAEKQLELIKWLSIKELKIRTNKQPYAVYIGLLGDNNTCFFGCEGLYFEQTLAELVNFLWQDLTEEEKQQIRDILKGLE
ncbi:MAG: hypothetical protein IJQ28_05365 [Clostridia bacterium]|nr:hypothetical protein [Clostridia bacterium]